MISLFDICDVGKAAARFDQGKLDWLNGHYLRLSEPKALQAALSSHLQSMAIDVSQGPDLAHVIAALQERSKNLVEMAEGARLFYQAPDTYDEKAVQKNIKDTTWPMLQDFQARAEKLQEWDATMIHALLGEVCEAHEAGLGKLAQPIRILVSGGPVSPPVDMTLALLGKDESIRRLQEGMRRLS